MKNAKLCRCWCYAFVANVASIANGAVHVATYITTLIARGVRATATVSYVAPIAHVATAAFFASATALFAAAW